MWPPHKAISTHAASTQSNLHTEQPANTAVSTHVASTQNSSQACAPAALPCAHWRAATWPRGWAVPLTGRGPTQGRSPARDPVQRSGELWSVLAQFLFCTHVLRCVVSPRSVPKCNLPPASDPVPASAKAAWCPGRSTCVNAKAMEGAHSQKQRLPMGILENFQAMCARPATRVLMLVGIPEGWPSLVHPELQEPTHCLHGSADRVWRRLVHTSLTCIDACSDARATGTASAVDTTCTCTCVKRKAIRRRSLLSGDRHPVCGSAQKDPMLGGCSDGWYTAFEGHRHGLSCQHDMCTCKTQSGEAWPKVSSQAVLLEGQSGAT